MGQIYQFKGNGNCGTDYTCIVLQVTLSVQTTPKNAIRQAIIDIDLVHADCRVVSMLTVHVLRPESKQ